MATPDARPLAAAQFGARPARETLLHGLAAAGLTLWSIGAHVDIWSHIHFGFEIESFFTWSHALFYAGWLLTGLAAPGWQRATGAPLPRGFRTYLLGVALFGLGGVVDLLWHSLFGFEVSQSAVLSPAHLWLALACALSAFGLLEATVRWRRRHLPASPSLRFVDLPLVLSLGMLLRVTTWFAAYADPLTVDFAGGGVIASGLQGYASLQWTGLTAQVAGTAGVFLRSVAVSLFLVVLVRHLRLPSGAIALMLLYDALLIVAATGQWPGLLAVAGAALIGELAWAWIQRGGMGGPAEQGGYWMLGGLVPLAQAALWLLALQLVGGGVVWDAHLWVGVPLTAGMLGLIAAMLAAPPRFLEQPSTDR